MHLFSAEKRNALRVFAEKPQSSRAACTQLWVRQSYTPPSPGARRLGQVVTGSVFGLAVRCWQTVTGSSHSRWELPGAGADSKRQLSLRASPRVFGAGSNVAEDGRHKLCPVVRCSLLSPLCNLQVPWGR